MARFDLIPDEDLKVFISSIDSETDNTKKQVKYWLSALQEFCIKPSKSTSYEDVIDIDNAAQRYSLELKTNCILASACIKIKIKMINIKRWQ